MERIGEMNFRLFLGGSYCFFVGGKQELGWHQTTEGLMVLLRDVVVLVIMVLQIAHLC